MRHILSRFFAFSLLSLALTSCWADDTADLDDGAAFTSGCRVTEFNGYAPLASRPVKIHYNIPAKGDMSRMPVLFVLPGLERNAADYLQAWKSFSDSRLFMVFVLEYPKESYTNSQYIEGGMFENGRPVPAEQWSFSLIEPVFERIKSDTGNKMAKYDMWGHSAGAQFVHRYVTFMPAARVGRAVAANAGWYTLPDPDTDYPYGLRNSGFDDEPTLRHLLSAELIVQLGTADTSRDGLNTTPGADAQGANRFARGNYYFSTGERKAAAGGYNFGWTRVEVEGVAHEYASMAADAATLLY